MESDNNNSNNKMEEDNNYVWVVSKYEKVEEVKLWDFLCLQNPPPPPCSIQNRLDSLSKIYEYYALRYPHPVIRQKMKQELARKQEESQSWLGRLLYGTPSQQEQDIPMTTEQQQQQRKSTVLEEQYIPMVAHFQARAHLVNNIILPTNYRRINGTSEWLLLTRQFGLILHVPTAKIYRLEVNKQNKNTASKLSPLVRAAYDKTLQICAIAWGNDPLIHLYHLEDGKKPQWKPCGQIVPSEPVLQQTQSSNSCLARVMDIQPLSHHHMIIGRLGGHLEIVHIAMDYREEEYVPTCVISTFYHHMDITSFAIVPYDDKSWNVSEPLDIMIAAIGWASPHSTDDSDDDDEEDEGKLKHHTKEACISIWGIRFEEEQEEDPHVVFVTSQKFDCASITIALSSKTQHAWNTYAASLDTLVPICHVHFITETHLCLLNAHGHVITLDLLTPTNNSRKYHWKHTMTQYHIFSNYTVFVSTNNDIHLLLHSTCEWIHIPLQQQKLLLLPTHHPYVLCLFQKKLIQISHQLKSQITQIDHHHQQQQPSQEQLQKMMMQSNCINIDQLSTFSHLCLHDDDEEIDTYLWHSIYFKVQQNLKGNDVTNMIWMGTCHLVQRHVLEDDPYSIALKFAKQNKLSQLSIVMLRHGYAWTIDQILDVLSQVPTTTPPMNYSHLMYTTLQPPADSIYVSLEEKPFIPIYSLFDKEEEEGEVSEWLTERAWEIQRDTGLLEYILQLDSNDNSKYHSSSWCDLKERAFHLNQIGQYWIQTQLLPHAKSRSQLSNLTQLDEVTLQEFSTWNCQDIVTCYLQLYFAAGIYHTSLKQFYGQYLRPLQSLFPTWKEDTTQLLTQNFIKSRNLEACVQLGQASATSIHKDERILLTTALYDFVCTVIDQHLPPSTHIILQQLWTLYECLPVVVLADTANNDEWSNKFNDIFCRLSLYEVCSRWDALCTSSNKDDYWKSLSHGFCQYVQNHPQDTMAMPALISNMSEINMTMKVTVEQINLNLVQPLLDQGSFAIVAQLFHNSKEISWFENHQQVMKEWIVRHAKQQRFDIKGKVINEYRQYLEPCVPHVLMPLLEQCQQVQNAHDFIQNQLHISEDIERITTTKDSIIHTILQEHPSSIWMECPQWTNEEFASRTNYDLFHQNPDDSHHIVIPGGPILHLAHLLQQDPTEVMIKMIDVTISHQHYGAAAAMCHSCLQQQRQISELVLHQVYNLLAENKYADMRMKTQIAIGCLITFPLTTNIASPKLSSILDVFSHLPSELVCCSTPSNNSEEEEMLSSSNFFVFRAANRMKQQFSNPVKSSSSSIIRKVPPPILAWIPSINTNPVDILLQYLQQQEEELDALFLIGVLEWIMIQKMTLTDETIQILRDILTKTTTSIIKADEKIVVELLQCGYSIHGAKRSAIMVKNESISAALGYAVANNKNHDFDEPYLFLHDNITANNSVKPSIRPHCRSILESFLQSYSNNGIKLTSNATTEKPQRNTGKENEKVEIKKIFSPMSPFDQIVGTSEATKSTTTTQTIKYNHTSSHKSTNTMSITNKNNKNIPSTVPMKTPTHKKLNIISDSVTPSNITPSVKTNNKGIPKSPTLIKNLSDNSKMTSSTAVNISNGFETPIIDSVATSRIPPTIPRSDNKSTSSSPGSRSSLLEMGYQARNQNQNILKHLTPEERKKLAAEGRRLLALKKSSPSFSSERQMPQSTKCNQDKLITPRKILPMRPPPPPPPLPPSLPESKLKSKPPPPPPLQIRTNISEQKLLGGLDDMIDDDHKEDNTTNGWDFEDDSFENENDATGEQISKIVPLKDDISIETNTDHMNDGWDFDDL